MLIVIKILLLWQKFVRNMMNKILIGFLLLFATTKLEAQNYIPIDTSDYSERKSFVKDFKAKNENQIKSLKEKYPGKTGKELAKIYTEFGTYFSKEIEEKNYTFKSEFEKYIIDIISELRKNHPKISSDIKVLIAKNNTPNAYCLADGTFVINMGLFHFLDNKEQIASVISHELSHKILEHSLKTQLENILADIQNKRVIEQLKLSTYNKSLKAFDILKQQTYKKGIINRKHEIESDSLGYLIYSKSDYKKSEFVNALKNLETYDTISPYVVKKDTYKILFNLPNQEFKEKWLLVEDFSNYNYNLYKEKINKDSVSSHPELDARIAFLKNKFLELQKDEKTIDANDEYKRLSKIAKMEILPNLFNDESYGSGIYACLQFIQENEETDYHKMWLGKCFTKIHEARKNYQLNRYLDQIDPKKQSESYRQFLSFMWNLNLEEIKNIAEFYNKSS
jgi:Peptidase family M48